MIGLFIAVVVATAGQSDEQAARAATVEQLQTAGANVATLGMCEMGGYVTDEDGRKDYVRRQVEDAQARGMYEEIAYTYLTAGMRGQSAKDLAEMQRITQLLEAGQGEALRKVQPMVDAVINRCDLLASRSETRSLFSYVPLNAQVARRLALKSVGLLK